MKKHAFLILIFLFLIENGFLLGIEEIESKTEAIDLLIESQNPDGGWGYGFGKQSFTEPTAFVTLALSKCTHKKCQPAATDGTTWLLETQNPDGGWGMIGFGPSDINTAIAVYSLQSSQAALLDRDLKVNVSIDRGINWLLNNRENHTLPPPISPITGGWAWTKGTYDFAEPTAYGIMGVSTKNTTDLTEAVKVLYDRQGSDGGWNVAKANRSQLLQTAVILTALKKANVTRSENITRALSYLEKRTGDMNTPLITAWSLIALDSYESEKASSVFEKLKSMHNKKGRFSNPYVIAIVMIALENHYDNEI